MNTTPHISDTGVCERFGCWLIDCTVGICQAVGECSAALGIGLVPGNWRRTMRSEFLRYLYQTGVLAIPAVLIAALLAAGGLVLQIIYWLDYAGQENRVGELLVLILVSEVAPLVSALIIVGRNGAALVDEVGQMHSSGHITCLQSHGIDPVMLLTIPRSFATAVATFLLTVLFMHTALASGYLAATMAGLTSLSAPDFVEDVLGNMTLADHLILITKPLLTGYTIAYVSIWFGQKVPAGESGVREILPRAFVVTLMATFAISAAMTVLF